MRRVTFDPYVYPGTDVLRNRPGLRDNAALAVFEDEVVTVRQALLSRQSLPGRYDLGHLQAFHRQLFAPVYPWAGELRTVAIARTDLFCLPEHLDSYAATIFGRLHGAEDLLRGRDRPEFVAGLAELWSDLNALHPFRDGNGRATRAFLGQLARHAGHQLDWSSLDPARNVQAGINSLRGDNTLIRQLVDDCYTDG